MFVGFNLKLCLDEFKDIIMGESGDVSYYKRKGENQLASKKNEFKKNIEEYIKNGIADGTKLEKDWFPDVKADIFISHSHSDADLAMALAGWLHEKFKVTCFIDSCVWGYVDDLLEMINSEYSNKREDKDGGYLYDHKKCNAASKHVNVMLCMALQKMIDKVETTIVINTENSISKYEDIYESATFSPWIYSEILCTSMVRRKSLSEYRKKDLETKSFTESYYQVNNEYKAVYRISLDHLKDIDKEKLVTWWMDWESVDKETNRYALDELYKLVFPQDMKKIRELHQKQSFSVLG